MLHPNFPRIEDCSLLLTQGRYRRPECNAVAQLLYLCVGEITNSDLGICLTQKRFEWGLSQRVLAKKTEISHSVISRLESGSIERVHFDYAIWIEKALKMDGELLALAWESGEYESGISLLKYINEKSVAQQKLHYTEWEQIAKAWADCIM